MGKALPAQTSTDNITLIRRLTHLLSWLTKSLIWLLFFLHTGFIVTAGIWLENAYMNTAVYVERNHWQGGTYMLYLGREPLPRQIFVALLVVFAVHTAWMTCWWLGQHDQTIDLEQRDLNRRRRRRYVILALHLFLTALVQFVIVAMRDVPEMKSESGYHIRFPFTWMPFVLVLVLLMVHTARTVYMEVMERYELQYAIAKHKNRGQLPEDQGADFDSSPFERTFQAPVPSQKSRREG